MADNSSSSSVGFSTSSSDPIDVLLTTSSSYGFSESSSSADSSSSSSQSSQSISSKSTSSASSLSSSSSSSFDSSSSSSSSIWELNGERMVPFIWKAEQSNSVRSFAYYGEYCFIGTDENGCVFRSKNRFNWEKFFETQDMYVSSVYVKNGYLFVATSPNGYVYRVLISDLSYDLIEKTNCPLVKFFELNSVLYMAAQKSVYKYDEPSNSLSIIYQPYGNITDVYVDQNRAIVSLDREDILEYDGDNWNLLPLGKDNISSFRKISTDPFSRISYNFIKRDMVSGNLFLSYAQIDDNLSSSSSSSTSSSSESTNNSSESTSRSKLSAISKEIATEDFIEMMPYNKEAGINCLSKWNNQILAGGKNYARLFSVFNNTTQTIFDTDGSGVTAIVPIDSKTIMAAMGTSLYLGYYGMLSNDQGEEVAETPTQVVPVQNPSEDKNIKVIYPNGGESIKLGDTVQIKWESTRGVNDAVKIEVHKNDQLFYSINSRTGNSGSYEWIVPSSFVKGNYKIYIEWLSASQASDLDKDYSDSTFEIKSTEVVPGTTPTVYPDEKDRWYFVKILDMQNETITSISKDDYYSQILLGTSNGRVLSTNSAKLNAYATGNRHIFACTKNEYGIRSGTATANVMYSLYNRLIEVSSSKTVEKWKFSRMAAISTNESITGVFISPVLTVKNDFGMWKTLIWEETKSGNSSIKIFLKAAKSISELYAKDWEFGFESTELESGVITRTLNNINLDGNYLQIKVEMESDNSSSMLSKIMVEYSVKNASYFFTTNFQMDSQEVATRGFVTANITRPVNTEVLFGITNKNTADWNEYTVVNQDTFFDIDNFSNLKIGVKLVSYDESLPVVSEFSLMRNK